MTGRSARSGKGVAFKVTVAQGDGGFAVRVNGKSARTPAGSALVLPTRALAEAIAGELRARPPGRRRGFEAVPNLRLAASALDRVAGRRGQVVDEILAFAATDLLCYRALRPPELAARQSALFQPLIEWAEARYAARLAVTTGIVPVVQSAAAMAALRDAVAAFDDMALAGLFAAARTSGSLVVALALAQGEIDAGRAFEVSQLEASLQMERWGEDEEAARRLGSVRTEIEQAAAFLALCRGRPCSNSKKGRDGGQ